MPWPSDPVLAVLLALRLSSVAPTDQVVERTGLERQQVDDLLTGLESAGDVRQRAGALAGWTLTPQGRRHGERLLADELAASGHRRRVEAAYRRFLELNPRLLAACTAWQVREVAGEPLPNDHADPDHDAAARRELAAVDEAAQPVCAELAELFERFAGYGERLARARRLVEAGDADHFTRPTVDSYHAVWFELHEHLLASLGIERSTERRGGGG